MSDAFARYLTRGKPGYALSEKITPEGAIAAIARAGGVAVLAHPWSTRNPRAALERFAPAGLSGVECYYGEYEPAVQNDLAELAAEFGLLTTGGSDYHGDWCEIGRSWRSVRTAGVGRPLTNRCQCCPRQPWNGGRMSTAAIVVAAGSGQRFGSAGKSFALTNGVPMAWWSLIAASDGDVGR